MPAPPTTQKIWRALESGRLPKETFDRLKLEHHHDICVTCREERAAYENRVPGTEESEGDSIAEREAAGRERTALLALPAAERMAAIRERRDRFNSCALAGLLLDESFGSLPQEPVRSLEFASLALVVAERVGTPARGHTVLAIAHEGNALRALGRVAEAKRRLQSARRMLCEPGDDGRLVTDLAVYAMLDWMEGTCCRETSEFERGEELYNRAILLFLVNEQNAFVPQVVLSLGTLYFRQGNARDALDAVSKVLEQLNERDAPELYWSARFNYAVYLAEAGHFAKARTELAACRMARPFAERPFVARRIRWTEGRIALGLGRAREAEAVLLAVREGYLDEESGINTALVSLDLAHVFLTTGEAAKLGEVAEEMALLFAASDVHREAMAALILFQETVRHEALTFAYLTRLRRYLEAARNNPELSFERAS